jgi:glycosyltransferase involved in cell wall biosynthesis
MAPVRCASAGELNSSDRAAMFMHRRIVSVNVGGLTPARGRCKGEALLDACAIVPAFNAQQSVGAVVADLKAYLGVPVILIDDGCNDGTSAAARDRGAVVVHHSRNRGKGAALRTGLVEAARRGFRAAVTVDADGQHPAASALAVLRATDDPRALVLGVRDLVRDGAPRSNRFGNVVSNFFLSHFSGRELKDTQCGLRRYPVRETLDLGTRAAGYAFEGEVLLRAVAANIPIVEVMVAVLYPPGELRKTHFRRVLDPLRIVGTIARTTVELRMRSSLTSR